MKLNRKKLRRLIESALSEHMYSPVPPRKPYMSAGGGIRGGGNSSKELNYAKYFLRSEMASNPEKVLNDIKRIAKKYEVSVYESIAGGDKMLLQDISPDGPHQQGLTRGNNKAFVPERRNYDTVTVEAHGSMRAPVPGRPELGGFNKMEELKKAKAELDSKGYDTSEIYQGEARTVPMSSFNDPDFDMSDLYGDGYSFSFDVAYKLSDHN